jgi:hypothetical protein
MKVGLKMELFSAQDPNLRWIYKDTSNRAAISDMHDPDVSFATGWTSGRCTEIC